MTKNPKQGLIPYQLGYCKEILLYAIVPNTINLNKRVLSVLEFYKLDCKHERVWIINKI